MIKSEQHAKQIQARRFASGKRGHAKAVRSYLRSNCSDNYQAEKKAMPANW